MNDEMGIGDRLSVLFLPVAVGIMLLLLITLPFLVGGDYTAH